MTDIDKLIDVMERLRAPGGCPWDREQTPETLKPMLIEEAYEVLEAIDSDDPDELKEELGDLLMQVVFHAQIARERGQFQMQDVIDAIHEKIKRRHPHVFGDVEVKSTQEVLDNWDRIKEEELAHKNKKRDSLLDGIPTLLPALYEAYELGVRASRTGFDWDSAQGVIDKIFEEIGEIKKELKIKNKLRVKEEIGDLLFSVVNLCRFLGIDPETSLKKTNQKFRKRFRYIESQVIKQGKSLSDYTLEKLERLWQEAKNG